MISGIVGVICLCFIILTGIKAHNFTRRAEVTTPPIGAFIDVDGTRIHYLKKGSGPALILLHGAGGNLRDYEYNLIPELSERYTVIAFDRPGHGYTDKLTSNGATLQEQSDLLHKAAQKLGIIEAYIAGYSFGGALALNWALEKPDFIKGLVLVSSVSMPWPGEVHLNYRMMSKPIIGPAIMATATAYMSGAYFRSRYATIFEPHPASDDFMDYVGVNMSVRFPSFVENARQLTTMRPQIVAQSQRYSSLDMPITLIHGVEDTSVPLQIHAQEFVKHVPQAKLRTIAEMGHAALQLAPKDVIQAIDTMISAQ